MSWKRNPYTHLYEWITGLRDQGYNHERIMKSFETCPATMMDVNDKEQVQLADIIIRHALGQAPDQEIEKYCFPTEVSNFSPFDQCSEGFIFSAETPEDEDDFYFLVEKSAINASTSLEDAHSFLQNDKERICNLVLYKAHTQHPYGVSGMPFETAKAKLTFRDFNS